MSWIFLSLNTYEHHVRKGFLSECVPVMISGMGGPGAPHHFEITRREHFGILPAWKP